MNLTEQMHKYKKMIQLNEDNSKTKKHDYSLLERLKYDLKKAEKEGNKNKIQYYKMLLKKYKSDDLLAYTQYESFIKTAAGKKWKEKYKVALESKIKQLRDAKRLREKWDTDYETPKSRRGMFKGKTREELSAELNAKKKESAKFHAAGKPEPQSLKTKIKELEFALRAKNHFGKVEESKLSEKWSEKMHTSKSAKGMWDGWTLEELRKEHNRLKKIKDKTPAQLKRDERVIFAIRAKQKNKWGSIKEEFNDILVNKNFISDFSDDSNCEYCIHPPELHDEFGWCEECHEYCDYPHDSDFEDSNDLDYEIQDNIDESQSSKCKCGHKEFEHRNSCHHKVNGRKCKCSGFKKHSMMESKFSKRGPFQRRK